MKRVQSGEVRKRTLATRGAGADDDDEDDERRNRRRNRDERPNPKDTVSLFSSVEMTDAEVCSACTTRYFSTFV